jgi:microcystin-dependent protein
MNKGLTMINQLVQTGMVLPFIKNLAPTGYLSCDGSIIDEEKYPELINLIGTSFSNDEFPRTPDLRSRVVVGSGEGKMGLASLSKYDLGEIGGVENTTQVVEHTHTMATGVGSDSNEAVGLFLGENDSGSSYSNTKNGTDTLATTAINETGVTSVENRQPFNVLHYIIKC